MTAARSRPAAPVGEAGAIVRQHRTLLRARRLHNAAFAILLLLAAAFSAIIGEVDLARLARGLPQIIAYVGQTLPRLSPASLGTDLAEWLWGLDLWLALLADTIVMAFVGTSFGAAGAFLLSFPATRTLVRSPLPYFISRRLLELARTVPDLVYALVFVYAFGLGPFAGVLAIAVHSVGSLGKLFAEANENADLGPLDAMRAVGGSWPQAVRFGIVPQVLPLMASYTLLRFEINVRGASVLGIVGAGGIGEELYLAVRQFIYQDISAIVMLILLTVMLIDMACERLRLHLIGAEAMQAARA